MARVEYTQLPIGEVATAAQLNSIFSAIATQTSAVDGENVQEGGLDHVALAGTSDSVRAFSIKTNSNTATQALTGSWVTCDPGGANPIRSTAFSLNSDELLVLRGSVELFTDATNYGLPAGGQIDVRFAFQRDANPVASVTPEVGATAATDAPLGTIVPILTVVSGATQAGVFNYVELQVSDQSGTGVTVQYGRVQMMGRIFKRVV
ncbi:MAG: hypothetical protein JSV86_05210 [Gemmatimonadota bacterium]|jgi:hypothetical protein|nr:MAG: hypothetical protein JSV86_05210 [Gemmatimonadota bacterium]